ncbi:MAG: GNAT family N-acetyltransferase [Pseudorhodoplanes sp.]
MAFFRIANPTEGSPVIPGDKVFLRAPQISDFSAWSSLRGQSRDFLVPWEPTWPTDDLTRAAFRRRLKYYAQDQRMDQAYPFFIFRRTDDALVGGLTLTNVRRGVAQTGSIGYWTGAPFARQGYMAAALRAFLPYAFDALRLRRIEAACIPDNTASMRLLEKSGFIREGYAREYLCIDGRWRDHLLYARLAHDPRP